MVDRLEPSGRQTYATAARQNMNAPRQNMRDPRESEQNGLSSHFLALQEQLQEQMRQTQQLIQVLLLKDRGPDNIRQSPCQCGNRS